MIIRQARLNELLMPKKLQHIKLIERLQSYLKPRLRVVVLALLTASTGRGLCAATFTASLDRDNVTLGESAVLSLKFEGGQPRAMPTLPSIANLQIDDQGSSSQIVINNGQFSSTLTENFVLTPRQPGDYTIPALQAEVGGQVLTSLPLKLSAVKAAPVPPDKVGDQLAFMKLVVPKKEAYVGEILAVELQVYIREGVANAENILQYFGGFGGTPLKAEGFSILKTAHAQNRRAQVGNGVYYVATMVTSLSPVKTGVLSIGSIDVNLPLQLPVAGQRRRDLFGMFQQYEEKKVVLTAEPETLNALALPREKVPSDFNGAVGNYSLTVSAGPTNVAMGDPITVKIQISGRGGLDSLTLPEQNAWHDFKTYPATSKIEADALGVQGTKTFEQVVVPQNADIKELPPVKFSFFDPDQKNYRALTQSAIPLVVRPAGSSPEPTILSGSRTGQDNAAAQDIVHIKARLGDMAQIGDPLVQRPWFLALQAVPVFGLVFAAFWRRRTDQLANNPRLRRQRQVAQITRTGLRELQHLAAEKKSDEFFATLFRLMQEQLGERLDLPASSITEAVIQEQLRPRGMPHTILDPLHELFQTCNLARYAPVKTSQELAALIPKFEAVLQDLQGVKL